MSRLLKRRSPHRIGDRLFAEAADSSIGPTSLGLGFDGLLGLNWFLGSSFRVFGPRLKGFGPIEICLKKFWVLLHSKFTFSHHRAFVAGSNRECLQFAPLVFRKLNFWNQFLKKQHARMQKSIKQRTWPLSFAWAVSLGNSNPRSRILSLLQLTENVTVFLGFSYPDQPLIIDCAILKFSWLEKSPGRDRRENVTVFLGLS